MRQHLKIIEAIGRRIEQVVRGVEGTASVYAEKPANARYIDVRIDRDEAARNWMSVDEIQETIAVAVGGMNISETVEGRERYPINLRYPPEYRSSVAALRALPMVTEKEYQVELGDVAKIEIKDGPDMIRSENARLSGWVLIDIRGRDLGAYVAEARQRVQEQIALPPGYSLAWSGQYEYLERAQQRLLLIIPLTVVLILVMLFMVFRNLVEPLLVMVALSVALVGGLWLLALLDYNLSVAVGVGFIALAGVAAEFGIVMLVYLDQAVAQQRPTCLAELREAVIDGAARRVRPKAMTATVIIAGLLPIMFGDGAGSEVMRRIAAPMVGGMITAPLVSMVLIPVLYFLWQRRGLAR